MTARPVPTPNSHRQSCEELQSSRIRTQTNQEAGIVLALGGGFSRGFAHLGVLEVLEQEGLPITAIVGTSIGALLGAAYADGISMRDLCNLGARIRIRDFLRFQMSHEENGEQKKDCIGHFVEERFRAGRLEELSIPTAIVATDLDTGAPFIFTRGPLEIAIRASCAFPGLVKPVEYEGRLLGDGCIVAAVPTEIAAGMYSGCVVGVSVGSNLATSSSDEVVRVLNSGLRTSRERAMEPAWCRHADILLEPQVHHIDWNNFSQVEEAFTAGAEAMRRALPPLRELLVRQAEMSQGQPQRATVSADQGLSL